ncbi:uncharacterized protein LOC144114256 isoform X1 [Amblyomma americanum]
MSSAQREPLNTEFSESTEFDRCLPPYKEINQADLPASLVIEDDLHSLTDVTASRPQCDDLSCTAQGLPEAVSARSTIRNNEDKATPSTVSFTYASTDPKSTDGLELESFSFEGSVSNGPVPNDMAKSPAQASHTAEPTYPYPTFPNVPDLQADISRAIIASKSNAYRQIGSLQNGSMGECKDGKKCCNRHSQLASDDFDEYYIKMLDAQKKQPVLSQEPPLCTSCSQSMMQYVSAIQTLIQQLTVDIIVKGKDPPDCSWCAREKLAAFQNSWPSSFLKSTSTTVSEGLNQNSTQQPCSSLHKEQAHVALSRPQAQQWPGSSFRAPVPHSAHSPNRGRNQLLYSALDVQNLPGNGVCQGEGPAPFQSLHLKSSVPAGQAPEIAEPVLSFNTRPLNTAFISSAGEQQNMPKQVELSPCSPKLPEGQGAASPKRSLSTVVCEPSEVVAQSLKGDEGIINPHYTESGDLQGSVKRPSELQLYNLGSSLQDKPADSAVSEGQHGGARRKQSLNSDWMTDLVQPLIPEPAVPSVRDQAYVTMANNDLSAIVCLVLGNSLWLSKTSRSLVVLVTDGVSHAFRHLLSCVFNVVLSVRSLGTQGTTKLALLEQPDIGVSFTKLHAWRLTQFSKCVFMDAGMLVVQNCDELFERDELSAVPDIGWPDCFNSGLFVYVPSMETFWDLISFAERQGSFDGGDQGLLNTYFRNWSSDINRRLPFIYNLMANVCYTYKPAFKQFGQNVKVVQFLGGYKPWNVKFHPPTGTLSPAADVHPTYVQFVQFWVQIFVKRVLPLFSSNIQAKTNEQRYTCALDILQHFPSFLVAEPMVCLPAPSLRAHPNPILYLPPGPRVAPEPPSAGASLPSSAATCPEPATSEAAPEEHAEPPDVKDDSIPLTHSEPSPQKVEAIPNHLPVAVDDNCNFLLQPTDPAIAVDDFSGMLAWEQGRADYMGEHCSDNIMAKLDELIGPGPGVQAK